MKTKCLIGGKWQETAESFEVKSPYTKEILAEVCSVTPDECEDAIAFANEASEIMKNLPRFRIAKG